MDAPLFHILKYLPSRLREAIAAFAEAPKIEKEYISEIRLRAFAPASVTYLDRNVYLFGGAPVILEEYEVMETLGKLCEDSVHTYGETMKEGFVSLENGYRIGVVGRAGGDGDAVKSVYGISSLSIRIPHAVIGVANEALRRIYDGRRVESALFFSPPNVGKTTLIRDLCLSLSTGKNARRAVIVDTRGEIYIRSLFSFSIADALMFYPRAKGIEIATRTMAPEVIFCDEIGSKEEARAILSAENSGVPLIATAHADSFARLLMRPNIRLLYDNAVFRYYIGLSRKQGDTQFRLSVTDTLEGTKERAS